MSTPVEQINGGEAELFHAVLHELTGEQFLDFVERFLNSKVLLPGMDVDGRSPASPPTSPTSPVSPDGRLDWINLPGVETGSPEYTHAHLECFQHYKALYESRLKATLKKFSLTEEEFITKCAMHVDAMDELSLSASTGSPKTAVNQMVAAEAPVGPGQICRTIIVMVECIESFPQFAELMAQTQLGEDTGDNDVDIESNGDPEEEWEGGEGKGKMRQETLERWRVINE